MYKWRAIHISSPVMIDCLVAAFNPAFRQYNDQQGLSVYTLSHYLPADFMHKILL